MVCSSKTGQGKRQHTVPRGNIKVDIFPDFSAEVQRHRQRFMEAKQQLQIQHLMYSTLFPARLRMEGEDRAPLF